MVKESGRSFVNTNLLDDQQRLIFVTDARTLEIAFTNPAAQKYMESQKDNSRKKESNGYKRIIHPEDYEDFILHLQALRDLPENQEEEITVRGKSLSRNGKKIHFRHRAYTGTPRSNGRYIIGIAKEIAIAAPKRNGVASRPYEKALVKSQQKNNVLLQNIREGYCLIDVLFDSASKPVDCFFLENNPAFEKLLNLDHILERSMKEISSANVDHPLDVYGTVALSRESFQFQSYLPGADKTCFDIHAFPAGGEDENRVGLLFSPIGEKIKEGKGRSQKTATNQQVDFQQQMNAQQEESNENHQLLKTIFNNTSIGLSILQPIYGENGELNDFLYLRANNLVLNAFPENLVGQSYLELNPESRTDGVFETFKKVMFTGTTEDFEIRKKRKGKKRWYRITARRENDVLITSIEDISLRKIKANRLKENIRFKKQIAEASPDIIMILNLQKDNVRYINRSIGDQVGMRKREIEGMPINRIIPFIHPHDREKSIEFHTRITDAEDKDIRDIEFRLKTRKDHWEWFNARAKVFMRNKENSVCEYILLLRNIDRQKETQKALLQAEKLSIKGEVARTLAHELRNPMASIGMAADILAQKTKSKENDELAGYIGIIKRSTNVLNKLVNDLLSSSNYTPFSPVKCCLAQTLESALKAAGDRIYLTGIKVIKDFDGTYNILADPEKLKIALLNIIVNASEAMNSDEGVLHLQIVRHPNDHVLSITDNGCGMEKDQLDKLFDAFYTQKPQGVGIGLNSVKSILEEHDAKILVNSKIKEGTSFHLTFHRYESFERT